MQRPDARMALVGLRVMVAGAAAGVPGAAIGHDLQGKLEGFLAYAETIGLDCRRQVLAIELLPDGTERVAGMCLWVPAPGRTATLFAPSQTEHPQTAAATGQAIVAALQDARAAGTVLVQALLEPGDGAGKTVFSGAGLKPLATLTYMERRPPSQAPRFELPQGLTLQTYNAATDSLFRQAIVATYEGTLDCPGLSGMRDVADVIEGHKGVGCAGGTAFDPQLWGVLMKQDQPVGCLLLAEIAARRALELVYLGLSPEVRGRGLGRVLMQRVLGVAVERRLEVMTLAVDAANTPAVALYRRCGYSSVAQRVAMVIRLV